MIKKIKNFITKQAGSNDNTILWIVVIGIFLVAALWTAIGIIGLING